MRRKYPTAPVAAVGVIIRDSGRILLVQRAKEPSRGHWTFPGGAIELGETAPEAARREALEETGLDVELGEVATILDNVIRDERGRVAYHYVIIDYFARPVGGVLRPGSDVADARWVDGTDWEELTLTASAGALLRELLAGAV